MFNEFTDRLALNELQLAVLLLVCCLIILVPLILVIVPLFKSEYFVNIYISNKVDTVYKVTVNDHPVPPASGTMEEAQFVAYSYIFLRETALSDVQTRLSLFKAEHLKEQLQRQGIRIHEAHIATNTGFGELYSNF